MQWILSALGLVLSFFVFSFLFIWKAKIQRGISVPGQFDFRRYKSLELSQRGLFDKTRWP